MASMDLLFSDAAKSGSFKRFPDGTVDFFISSDFTVDCATVSLNGVLARGSYGIVYRGTWNGEVYAVKIEDFTTGVEEQINLIVELTLLQSLPHDRMVRFYGAGYQADSFSGPKVPYNILIHIIYFSLNDCILIMSSHTTFRA